MNDQPSREEALFEAALEISDPRARAAHVAIACGDDADLRRRVEALLRESERACDFLEDPPLGKSGHGLAPAENPGDRIGPYKLLERLGEGGCGTVYMAEQAEPIRRRVALKVVKLGMDTREVIARFGLERQALALMDHPNIARVFDAGATDTGRPYFVMELVRGTKITEFCDENELSPNARLDLFVKVCQAIQHAHQKGIIHRDIKPSNILVTLHDGEPVPKVIDFGIAKATGQQLLTDQTVFTALKQFIGTPAYMSPEQSEMTALDIDTRSDIYSLGVLLYEVLTSQTPFDEKKLLAAGLDAMRQTIRETEPPRPSTRLRTMLIPDRTRTARCRQTDPVRLIHLLRGDLDWIAMKCLEKDRNRRYATANGLAADIQRHLKNEPVVARPPSRSYLLQKLVSRNKGTVAAVSAVAAALIVSLATSTFLYLDEAKVRQALSREAAHARLAEANAEEELHKSYLAQAQAGRWSRRAGRRFEGLELLKKAAAVRPSLELRNEAIACMALSDVRVVKQWDAFHPTGTFGSFDANYQRYVFGDAQGTVHVARVEDASEVAQFPGYEPPFHSLEFSPDGRFLFVACGPEHTRIELLDLNRNEVFLRLPQVKFRTMGFSADSRLAAVSYNLPNSNCPVRIFDLVQRKEASSFAHGSLPYFISFHPWQPNLLLTSDWSPVVRVWDLAAGTVLRSLTHPDWVQGIGWHPNGHLVATACADGKVRLWDAASGKDRATLAGHHAEAVAVTFSHDGEFLASRGWDGMLRLWDPSSQRELVDRQGPGFIYHFSRVGNRLGIGLQPGKIALLDVASGQGYRVLGSDPTQGDRTLSCAFSSDGRMIVSAHQTKVRCWDMLTGEAIAEIPKPSGEHFAVVMPDGQRLFLGTRERVEEWSLTRSSPPQFRCERANLGPGALQAYIMTLSQDGRQLAVSAENELQIIDTQSGRKTAGLKPPYAPVFGALSPDARLAATWSRASTNVQIWDVLRSAMVRQLPAHLCNHASFSPNNQWLLVGNVMEFRVWDAATWQSRYTLPNEAAGFYGYSAFSPDSRMLAVATSRTTVRLVNAESGRELATLQAPEPLLISWIAFSPDGTQLAVAIEAGPIQVWDLRSIRRQLASMNLDWEMPPYALLQPSQPPGPLQTPMPRLETTAGAGMPR